MLKVLRAQNAEVTDSEARGGDFMKIKIVFKDGEQVTWKKKQFTDYMYDRKCFIVIRKKQWVGIYNLDCISCIWIE